MSDIHLDASRPATYQKFIRFLHSIQSTAEEIYILGDLFEYWIGDDCVDLLGHQPIVNVFKQLSDSGVKIMIMHGNRDFLIGETFVASFGGRLLPPEHIITAGTRQILLMHGDSLCTDDVEHQAFRKLVLTEQWQNEFLSIPLEVRNATVLGMRRQSEKSKSAKPMEIMDVNQKSVLKTLHQHQVSTMIHGHVHKQGIHKLNLNGVECQRYVLGDWDSGNDGAIEIDSAGKIRLYCPDIA